MTKSIVLLLLLAVSVFSTDSTMQQLQEIDKSKFGKTMLDSIELELEAGGAVESLVKQLAFIESQLQADQRASDEANQKFQDKCDADIKFFEDYIAKLAQKMSDLEEEIATKKPILAEKIERRASQLAQIVNLKKAVDIARAERRKEVNTYDKIVAEHQFASLVINQARKIFDKTFSSGKTNLLEEQHNQCFDQLSEHFERSSNTDNFKIRSSYNQIFKILSQITSGKALRAGGMVGRVYELFKKLLISIENSLINEQRAEATRIKLFKAAIKRYLQEIAVLTRSSAQLNAEIMALQFRIKEAGQEWIEANRTKILKENQMQDEIKECDDAAEAYKNERFKRNDESNVVSQLIGLVQSKLRQIRSFTKSRN